MSRIAFVMDRLFRKFGLSGKSFIPMLIATGCGVPGVMASRTIENEQDRRLTIMVTTFMPCSAKLPIIALIAGAFFPHTSWVAPSAYFLGMSSIVLSGIMLKKTKLFAGGTAAVLLYNGGSIVELNEAKKQVESMQKEVTHFGRSL